MKLIILENDISEWVANYIAKKIKEFNFNKPFVLGLPTGSTPLNVYKKLIKLYQDGEISFKNVVTFNMDEYVGLKHDNVQSYHYYMNNNFFKYIDIPKENINILDGMAIDINHEAEMYEKKIKSYGGIDIFLGGIGSNGHIAFNEPGSKKTSRTRIQKLCFNTIKDNSRFFENDIKKVPKFALTVGIATLMDSKEIIIMANGKSKSQAVYHAIEDNKVNDMYPITFLKEHDNTTLVIDKLAASNLKEETLKKFYKKHSQII